MSGRRRRFETSWDNIEEKRPSAEVHSNVSPRRSQNWSKSEDRDDLMHGNFSRSPSWDPLQGNRNGPKDDNIRRDRNRMYSHSTFDKWEKQYNTHPSDDSYGLPYRSRDKGKGGNGQMSREPVRERTRSPNGSRSRSRDGGSRSSWESSRGRRHETNGSYPNMRNSSKDFASRDGGNNRTESWSRRTDYKDASRYNDYPHRNVSDDYRNTRIPCRYFAAGNCNRDNCRFSHDVPETSRAYDGNRNLGNKNRTWRNDQQPHDNLNARSKHAEMEKKYCSSWDDAKSGGFDEISHQGHTSGENNNKNTAWDSCDDEKMSLDGHASLDASGVHDVGKSHLNFDTKKSSWNGPTSWDDASGPGFSNVSIPCHKYEESAKESLIDSNAKDRVSAKSGSNIDRNLTRKWNGPLWDELSEPETTDNSKIGMWECPGLNKMASDNAEVVVNDSDLNNIVPQDAKQVLTSGQDLMQSHHDMNTQSRYIVPEYTKQQVLTSGQDLAQSIHDMNTQSKYIVPEDTKQQVLTSDPDLTQSIHDMDTRSHCIVPEDTKHQVLTSGHDLTQSVHDMNTRSHSYLNGSDQSRTLLSNPFNGPFNGQVQGMHVHMDNQNEGGKSLEPLEMDSQQPQAMNETSQVAPQANLYTELHLTNAINYLRSLPNSAYNQDTRANEEQNPVRNTEVNISAPMGILSSSVTQQNQMPADLTHDSSKLGGTDDVMGKEAFEGIDKRVSENGKKQEQNTNGDNSEAPGKAEGGDIGNDEKAIRQFKVGLVDFVKEILKPKWKEGKMSREVHKAIVKKVVEKVTSSIQGTQIPRTQPKIEQYLAHSKPKITKLVEAYAERLQKA